MSNEQEKSGEQMIEEAARQFKEQSNTSSEETFSSDTDTKNNDDNFENTEDSSSSSSDNGDSDDGVYAGLSDLEKQAYDEGWRPKDQFVKDGKKGDHWVSAYEYVRYGKLQKELRSERERVQKAEENWENRFKSLNDFHLARLEAERAEAKTKKLIAVENADTDQFKEAEKELERIEQQESKLKSTQPTATSATAEQPQRSENLQRWIDNNPWLKDETDPRSHFARSVWDAYVKRHPDGVAESQTIKHVEAEMDRVFKSQGNQPNPMRRASSPTETGKATPKKQNGHNYTLASIPNTYRNLWEKSKDSLWKNADGTYREKDFLQSIADNENYRR